ncbi:nose resistant to fluoxetine protein 6-like [Uloborus diversus]|uniref:nose resistant to fluoxetine protein 6-like n=1 Tax=Uloborus diversus TaxID=327109 RepID=UPI0024099D67|nr:nose resistant to fluoxetine protein 6-like [Uloborus diversus]
MYTLRAIDFFQDFAFQAIANSFHISDTFFVIGGAVSCYVVVTYVKTKGRPFNIPMYIINRLTRILPVYIYFILFIFLLELFGSGPFWNDFAASQIQNCYNKWWYNLLFINNLYDAESMCAHHTWYLACDFQFYLAAIFILLPLIKRPKVGISMSVFIIIASSIACGYVTWFYDYPPTAILNGPNFM